MGLFGSSKQSKQKKCNGDGCCNTDIIKEDAGKGTQSDSLLAKPTIRVFGSGCAKCKTLKENVLHALSSTGTQADFEYVTDMDLIVEAGIIITPALEINGKIVSRGTVLKPKDIAQLL